MNTIADNLHTVRSHIDQICTEAGRDPSTVKLIAVSKTRTLDDVQAAVNSGQYQFGENTIQDALRKIPYVTDNRIEWHFIGHLQSKKAKDIPGNFRWLHSVDSLKLAEKLSVAVQHSEAMVPMQCLIQLNLTGERNKYGIDRDALDDFVATLLRRPLPGLRWRGLMAMGVHHDNKATRAIFRQTRDLLAQLSDRFQLSEFDQLSMGMSGDYKIAIEEGSTMVRLGTAVFGERPD